MRVVADTNTLVSGSLWPGVPRQLLDLARTGACQLITSEPLLNELAAVLGRGKFQGRLERAGLTVESLLGTYRRLAQVVSPAPIPPTVLSDPADDQVLAAALSGQAHLIVSGDADLLTLSTFRGIRILTARQAISVLAEISG